MNRTHQLIIFLFPIIISACTTSENDKTITTSKESISTEKESSPTVLHTPTSSIQTSVEHFLKVPFSVGIKTVEKVHNHVFSNGKDTLSEIVFEHSTIRILNHTAIEANIYDKGILVAYNIQVGTSKDEFFNIFTGLDSIKNENPLVKITPYKITLNTSPDEPSDRWEFYFDENDQVEVIKYDHFLDRDINKKDFSPIEW